MILKHKKLLLLTSLLTLLPMVAYFPLKNHLPAEILSVSTPVFLLSPLSLLAGQWLCVYFTSLDTSNQDRNEKVQKLVLWIMPLLSNLMCGVFCALLLGAEIHPFGWFCSLFGLLFILIGNYLPKTRMNSTIGIKIKWTYSSEANWNATHRLAGRLWVICGLVLIPLGFLPGESAIGILTAFILIMCLVPVLYSRQFYRKELASGAELNTAFPAENTKVTKISLVIPAIILVFCCLILWSGDLEYRLEGDNLIIEADWYNDLTLPFDAIETIEYRRENVPGTRVGGFGSFRLLMGFFTNEEFGLHTRYTYYNPDSCVVLTTRSGVFVLSAENDANTYAIYQMLCRFAEK